MEDTHSSYPCWSSESLRKRQLQSISFDTARSGCCDCQHVSLDGSPLLCDREATHASKISTVSLVDPSSIAVVDHEFWRFLRFRIPTLKVPVNFQSNDVDVAWCGSDSCPRWWSSAWTCGLEAQKPLSTAPCCLQMPSASLFESPWLSELNISCWWMETQQQDELALKGARGH